jgi:hypothetical protein
MSAHFIDVADKVFNEIYVLRMLLPLCAVSRRIKHYADRRICQLILHEAAALSTWLRMEKK